MTDAPTLAAMLECIDFYLGTPAPKKQFAIMEAIRARLAEQEDRTLPELPEGWRLTSIDCSIEGRCAVTIMRSGMNYEWWYAITEAEQEAIPLYISAVNSTLRAAVLAAIAKINQTEG